jgi:hypothetical protein
MTDKEIINLQNDEGEILPIEVLNSECYFFKTNNLCPFGIKCQFIHVSVQKSNNNICEFRN